jgi:diguanylate cyclase (GGDEF)-like protein
LSLARYGSQLWTTALAGAVSLIALAAWALHQETKATDAREAARAAQAAALRVTALLDNTRVRLLALSHERAFTDWQAARNLAASQRWAREARQAWPEALSLSLVTPEQVMGDTPSGLETQENVKQWQALLGQNQTPTPHVGAKQMSVPLLFDAKADVPRSMLVVNFDTSAIEAALAKGKPPNWVLLLQDNAGATLVQTGEAGGLPNLTASVPVNASAWKIDVRGKTPIFNPFATMIFGGFLLFGGLTVIIGLNGRRLLTLAATETNEIAHTFENLSGHFSVTQVHPYRLLETDTLAAQLLKTAQEQSRRAEELAQSKFSDPVTGLPYREIFFERLRHGFELAKRANPLSLLLIETQSLAKASEVLGANGADAVLKQLAATLAAHTRKSDFAARLGMHHFAVIFFNAKAELMMPRLLQIRADFEQRQTQSPDTGQKVWGTIFLGLVAINSEQDAKAEDAFKRAQDALETSKKEGRIVIQGANAPQN